MLVMRLIVAFMTWIAFVEGKMEPFVVGGKFADIRKFPHSVFLSIECFQSGSERSIAYICGGSIINERIILTAAHCLYDCTAKSTIAGFVGHEHEQLGAASTAHGYIIHAKYHPIKISNDVGLVRLKTSLTYSKNVKRIILMKNPPYFEKAQIAGWGLTDEIKQTWPMRLKYVDQYVYEKCKQVIPRMPKGTICACSGNPESYISSGDSGSALVVRGYIQIGIVSYKMPRISHSLAVYTDTGYFYKWIKKNSRRLYCAYIIYNK